MYVPGLFLGLFGGEGEFLWWECVYVEFRVKLFFTEGNFRVGLLQEQGCYRHRAVLGLGEVFCNRAVWGQHFFCTYF